MGKLTVINVHKQWVARDRKDGQVRPCISVKRGNHTQNCHVAELLDDQGRVVAKLRYDPAGHPRYGVKVWLETELEVTTHVQPNPVPCP